MKNPNLLTRSSYTFFNSLLKIEDIINFSIKNGFSNAFLIDKNIMYGASKFYELCLKNNIKPIIGIQIEYENFNEVIIAKNYKGYKELIRISSFIQLKKELVIDYSNLIKPKNYFIPVLYKKISDVESLKIFHSVSNKEFSEASSHFLNREEFELINGTELLKEVDSIIDEVNLVIPEKINVLPSFKVKGKKVDSTKYLEKLLKQSLSKYLKINKNLDRKKYIERTSYEFSIIKKMKFENYFLIVSDIVNWSKNKGIFVGPGRGSAPGSIISFLLNITIVDPIANNLLFERFLNPERISMPDIDIDFEDTRRDEVINYIVEKYGKDNVAQIITFQTLKAKMSFKDVARIKKLSALEANNITKLLSDKQTLEEAYENKNGAFRRAILKSELLEDIYNTAKLIEGLPRQYSTHAAGIVISDEKIYKSIPIQEGYGDIIQTQYPMNYMEYNGLLKIDILGLKNLSFINETIHQIEQNNSIKINLNRDVDFNDEKIYEYLASGKTSGIFQLESPGMRSVLKKINVSKFEEVVASTSLFRPGPSKMIPEFVARKAKVANIEYLDEKVKKILESTYGIIVYQEQIIELVQIISKFSLAKADILRRAIGKKDLNAIKSLKEEFFNGGIENNYKEEDVKKIYDLIVEFSNYGFNRSHAFSYTIISCWLTWLKINYPLEFMNSLLNSVIGNNSKTPEYILECEDMNIEVCEPSIFNSSSNYSIINNKIFMGFKSIKKIGDSVIKNIINLQSKINKETTTIYDFFIEAAKAGVSFNVLIILIKSNALRELNFNKQTLLGNLETIEEWLKLITVKNDDETLTYDDSIIPKPKIQIYHSPYEKEYFSEVFGFSLNSNDLMKRIREVEKNLKNKKIIDDLDEYEQDKVVVFIAEIISIKEITTKNGEKMAFIDLNNGKNKINATFWPRVYQKFIDKIAISKILLFQGKMDLKRKPGIIINNIKEIENEK
ncbi:MAG: DNA-directed DNA polymerase [Candidatus Tyloplasma litorale]|nr:MAG: DNA-directed DNA polymerase [Mycoplasmatales bacterium]